MFMLICKSKYINTEFKRIIDIKKIDKGVKNEYFNTWQDRCNGNRFGKYTRKKR